MPLIATIRDPRRKLRGDPWKTKRVVGSLCDRERMEEQIQMQAFLENLAQGQFKPRQIQEAEMPGRIM
jgi:hypothetical protein